MYWKNRFIPKGRNLRGGKKIVGGGFLGVEGGRKEKES